MEKSNFLESDPRFIITTASFRLASSRIKKNLNFPSTTLWRFWIQIVLLVHFLIFKYKYFINV